MKIKKILTGYRKNNREIDIYSVIAGIITSFCKLYLNCLTNNLKHKICYEFITKKN